MLTSKWRQLLELADLTGENMRPKGYKNSPPKLLQQYWRYLTLFIVVGAVGVYFIFSSFAATTNITVDFNTQTQKLAYKPFSGSVSTYGNQYALLQSAAHRTALTNLKLGMYRVPIRWNNGNPMSAANGHPGGSGLDWVSKIKGVGSEPMIVVGGEANNNFSAQDAANLVRYFNITKNNKVTYWVLGNESDNGGQGPIPMSAYCNLFNSSAAAMKAVDPTIKLVGPAISSFKPDLLREFLQCAKNNVDVLDWHEYPNSDNGASNEQLLSWTYNQANRVREARRIINEIIPERSSKIELQLGEINWSWNDSDDRPLQAVQTVWAAADFGGIVTAGGRVHVYPDINGKQGLTYPEPRDGRPANAPSPIYWAMFMYTGGNLFRGFGDTAVKASTTLSNVDVFASTNQKSVVAVNKDPNAIKLGSVQMTGMANGTLVDVWQTDKNAQWSAPKKKATLTVNDGKVEYDLAPYSVTTFVIGTETTPPPVINPPSVIAEDINQDGKVNLTDLSALLTKFNQSGASVGRADIDSSGKVDIKDLSRLLTKFQH